MSITFQLKLKKKLNALYSRRLSTVQTIYFCGLQKELRVVLILNLWLTFNYCFLFFSKYNIGK